MPQNIIDELGIVKLQLENHIKGLQIQKAASEQYGASDPDVVQTLDLMNRIMSILNRIEPVPAKPEQPYTPVCPLGFKDCVTDPAYIQYNYPDWYHKMYGDKSPEEILDESCREIMKLTDNSCYDDEDK